MRDDYDECVVAPDNYTAATGVAAILITVHVRCAGCFADQMFCFMITCRQKRRCLPGLPRLIRPFAHVNIAYTAVCSPSGCATFW